MQSTVEDLADQLNNFQAALNVSLLVFDNGATKAAVESARNQVAAGRADLKNVEQQVLFNAVQAYVDVLRDQEFVRLASNDVDRLTETLSATQNRFDVGEVTRTDVSQSQSRLSASRSTLAAAEGQLEISRQAYRQAVGTLPGNLEPAAAAAGAAEDAGRGHRDRHPAQSADHLGAVRRALGGLRLRPGDGGQGAAGRPQRLGRRRARQQDADGR